MTPPSPAQKHNKPALSAPTTTYPRTASNTSAAEPLIVSGTETPPAVQLRLCSNQDDPQHPSHSRSSRGAALSCPPYDPTTWTSSELPHGEHRTTQTMWPPQLRDTNVADHRDGNGADDRGPPVIGPSRCIGSARPVVCLGRRCLRSRICRLPRRCPRCFPRLVLRRAHHISAVLC